MTNANSRMSIPDAPSETYRFIVAGIALNTCRKKLKPAFPKKKDIVNTKVHLSGIGMKLTVSLTGAAVGIPALVTEPFEAEIPFKEFVMIVTDKHDDGDIVTFELSPGRITTCGVSSFSPDVWAKSAIIPETKHDSPDPMMNLMNTTVGAMLLPAYVHMRRHGLQLNIADRVLVQQQLDVQRILEKANNLLAPLGLTRLDIERILDQWIKAK